MTNPNPIEPYPISFDPVSPRAAAEHIVSGDLIKSNPDRSIAFVAGLSSAIVPTRASQPDQGPGAVPAILSPLLIWPPNLVPLALVLDYGLGRATGLQMQQERSHEELDDLRAHLDHCRDRGISPLCARDADSLIRCPRRNPPRPGPRA